jgi:hypothetical protein
VLSLLESSHTIKLFTYRSFDMLERVFGVLSPSLIFLPWPSVNLRTPWLGESTAGGSPTCLTMHLYLFCADIESP